MRHPLPSWRDGAARTAIVDFVERVCTEGGPDHVPPAERIAVFDNDGTLWCEKPMPIELGFILKRLAEMAEHDPALADRQPWKAAHERDFAWLGDAMTKHYRGDEGDVKLLIAGVMQAYAGWTVEDYADAAATFMRESRHPTLDRSFLTCGYAPMVELLRHLEAYGFTCYIASGGNRDFMRVFAEELYGVPPERIVGSSNALRYADDDGSLSYLAEPDVFDDGPVKPVRIWSRIGRRPIIAGGNSNGDIPMLAFAGGPSRPALRLLVLHDDAEREFDYAAGSEHALERAAADDWTVVSIKDSWSTVFAAD
jgi:phosphoserine phosphatase